MTAARTLRTERKQGPTRRQDALNRVFIPRGPAVFGRLLAILGGVGPVGRGLEPVQGGLLSFFAGVVTTCGSSIAGLDQVGAVTGAEVTVAATPVPIDPSVAPVQRGILDRNPASLQVAQFRRQVPCPGLGVTMIRCDIPRDRPVQDLIDRRVPLAAAPVPLVGNAIPMISGAVPGICCGVPLVGHSIPLVRGTLPLAQPVVPLRHVRLRTLAQSAWPTYAALLLTRTTFPGRDSPLPG